MKPTAMLLAASILSTGLAGCLGLQQGGTGDADGRGSDPIVDHGPLGSIELTGCVQHEAFFPIQSSEAEPYLPDGFGLVGVGGGPLPEGMAVLFVQSFACEGSDQGETTNHLWVTIMVDPPAAYEKNQTLFHLVPVIGVASNETLAATWSVWGIPRIFEADVGFEVRGDPPLVVETETLANLGGDGLRFASAVLGPPVQGSAGEGRIFGVQDGEVTGMADYSYSEFDETVGEATLENEGLLPFDVQGPGEGGHFVGVDNAYRYVEPPASMEGAT